MKKLTHIDLFAGPGGICTGFKAAGLQTVAAVEYVDSCVDTYRANHPEVEVIGDDIREVSDRKIRSILKKAGLSSVDVVSAGFPCETFSTAGSNSRVYDDHRNLLYKEAIRIADAVNARILMLENVPAFMTKKMARDGSEKVIDMLIEDLEKAGFVHHAHDVLNAADYGVPQNRTRFIMLASKTIPVQAPHFNGGKLKKRVTVQDALADLPHIGHNSESNEYAEKASTPYQKLMRSLSKWNAERRGTAKLTYHITPKHRPGTLERFKYIEQGEGLRDLFNKLDEKTISDLQAQRVLPKKWYIQRNQRLVPEKQSHTVTSHCLEEMVHPTLDRGPSVREVARLQSFPDWYDFKGGPLICPHIYKTQDKYEQIGDAVPPLLAKHLGKSIMKILERAGA